MPNTTTDTKPKENPKIHTEGPATAKSRPHRDSFLHFPKWARLHVRWVNITPSEGATTNRGRDASTRRAWCGQALRFIQTECLRCVCSKNWRRIWFWFWVEAAHGVYKSEVIIWSMSSTSGLISSEPGWSPEPVPWVHQALMPRCSWLMGLATTHNKLPPHRALFEFSPIKLAIADSSYWDAECCLSGLLCLCFDQFFLHETSASLLTPCLYKFQKPKDLHLFSVSLQRKSGQSKAGPPVSSADAIIRLTTRWMAWRSMYWKQNTDAQRIKVNFAPVFIPEFVERLRWNHSWDFSNCWIGFVFSLMTLHVCRRYMYTTGPHVLCSEWSSHNSK